MEATIQEALNGLPDLSNPEECEDNKLLIPMLTTEILPNGTSQVQMVLKSNESSNSSNRGMNINVTAAHRDDRSSAVSDLDSIMCELVDESIAQMNDESETDDITKHSKPS